MSKTVWIVVVCVAGAAFFALPALLAFWAAPRNRRERMNAMQRNLDARKAHSKVNVRGVQLPDPGPDENPDETSDKKPVGKQSSTW